jgi:hypothetical protein
MEQANAFTKHDCGPAVTASAWWEPFADVVPGWFATYLTLEPNARLIHTYETQYLPGLFQTPAYSRAVMGLAHTDPADVERRVELREARQRLLDQPEPPEIQAVIGEGALTRSPMTPSQRRAQLDRLIALTERSNITMWIVAAASDIPRIPDSAFTVLSFTDLTRTDLVYLEESDGARYLVEPADVAHYRDLMAELSATHQTAGETRAILRQLRAGV